MSMRLSRRSLIALAFAAVAASPLSAFAADDGVAFVKALYKLPNLWSDVAGSAESRRQYLTPDFAKAVEENGRYSAELDFAVDYEPLTQAQDWELKNLKFAPEKTSGDAALVRVDFINFDRPTTVRFSLKKGAGGWQIADLFNDEGASLLQEYKDLNVTGRAVNAAN